MEEQGLIWEWSVNYKCNLVWLKYSNYLRNNASQDLGGKNTDGRKGGKQGDNASLSLLIQKGNSASPKTGRWSEGAALNTVLWG